MNYKVISPHCGKGQICKSIQRPRACLTWKIVEVPMSPRGEGESTLCLGTLWLCQNSYWKWPLIVDFPIKKWWFSIVFCMFTRGYHNTDPETAYSEISPWLAMTWGRFFFWARGRDQCSFCDFDGTATFEYEETWSRHGPRSRPHDCLSANDGIPYFVVDAFDEASSGWYLRFKPQYLDVHLS